jgi:hypothetical protein
MFVSFDRACLDGILRWGLLHVSKCCYRAHERQSYLAFRFPSISTTKWWQFYNISLEFFFLIKNNQNLQIVLPSGAQRMMLQLLNAMTSL